jgi:hypothetical protein
MRDETSVRVVPYKCSNCGSEVNEEASQCPACGARFEEERSVLDVLPAALMGVGAGVALGLLLYVLRFTGNVLTVGLAAGTAVVVWTAAELAR